jgi:hypothetical protein
MRDSLIGTTVAKHPPKRWLVQCLTSQKVFPKSYHLKKGKGLPQQAEMSQRGPGRLRPRIFLTFGTTRVVGRQPYAPGRL